MRFLYIVLVLLLGHGIQAQDPKLAANYMRAGEYEKAADVYKQLSEKFTASQHYFDQYIQALISADDLQTAEDAINKKLKKNPQFVQLYVTYGNLLERTQREDEALKKYKQAIDDLPSDKHIVTRLASSFQNLAKYDLAIQTYEKGEVLLESDKLFVNNLAELYRRKGDKEKMIEYYIRAASNSPTQYKTNFKRYITDSDDLDIAKTMLYEKIQEFPESTAYPELLELVFIEQKDYKSALRQARSIDRALQEDGSRIINIANIASNAGDTDAALKAYSYIIDNQERYPNYYIYAKSSSLKAKRRKITRNYDYTEADLDTLAMEYKTFLAEMGTNSKTEYMVKEYADFLAVYKNDLDSATKVLEDLLELQSVNKLVRAQAKIALADYYLMQGNIWESTLLYSQVEKNYKEEHLGEVSRFKNAMLAYYAGEFGWAQEQFDILESATSRLISNDAIDMSIFIMDNMGLDTTDVPLKMYADSELLNLQNRYDEAFVKLDSINLLFPEHSLEDDIYYLKADLYYKTKNIEKAVELYSFVYETYPEEIRADNALYKLARIQEHDLNDNAKAMELYEKLFIDFSNSTFAIDARKRFRQLRGDDI